MQSIAFLNNDPRSLSHWTRDNCSFQNAETTVTYSCYWHSSWIQDSFLLPDWVPVLHAEVPDAMEVRWSTQGQPLRRHFMK